MSVSTRRTARAHAGGVCPQMAQDPRQRHGFGAGAGPAPAPGTPVPAPGHAASLQLPSTSYELPGGGTRLRRMSGTSFAIFCFIGFALPAALIVWFDRPQGGR